MPTAEGLPPGVVWPGQEGQPAWAIPVTVPAGTRGYALFLPLVPASLAEGQRPAPVAVIPAQPATGTAPA
ncbi:DUF4173 domain-containing protein, partial [Micromonospora globispora]